MKTNTCLHNRRFWVTAFLPAFVLTAFTVAQSQAINISTRNYNNQRTGANLSEIFLTTSNVNSSQFGKLFQNQIDDQVYAGLLYAAGLSIGGATPAFDGNGNLYVPTGNGDWNGSANFGETLLKLAPRTLNLLDWFTPSNWMSLNNGDLDLGSSGPVFLPGTNLLVIGGKGGGKGYLIDSNNLGHLVNGDTQIRQVFQAVELTNRIQPFDPATQRAGLRRRTGFASTGYAGRDDDYFGQRFSVRNRRPLGDHATRGRRQPGGRPGGSVRLQRSK
jgi:hypothetical protein